MSHTLKLTQGGVHLLKQLAVAGLITDVGILFRYGQYLETNACDLQLPKLGKDEDSDKIYNDWNDKEFSQIEISEKTRDALKNVVTAAIGKGILPAGRSTVRLIQELGLAPEN